MKSKTLTIRHNKNGSATVYYGGIKTDKFTNYLDAVRAAKIMADVLMTQFNTKATVKHKFA